MAATRRRRTAALIDALFAAPERYEFRQAVRLIERHARRLRQRSSADDGTPRPSAAAGDAVMRFKAATGLAFPLAEIEQLGREGPQGPAVFRVTFLGLNGPSGVLPRYYSELVLRSVKQKSTALRDLLDLLNHRAIVLHLAASRKYRLPANVENAAAPGGDALTAAIFALIGFGTAGLRDRLAVEDATLLYYSGLFAQTRRSAVGLKMVVSDYLGLPIRIEQFAGRWTALADHDLTRLGGAADANGRFAALGVTTVAGRRVWDVQGSFRIRIGPLDYRQFAQLLPGSALMREVAALVRTYAGPTLAYDIALDLKGETIPECQLVTEGAVLPRLGWNTWLAAQSRPAVVSDAVMRYATI